MQGELVEKNYDWLIEQIKEEPGKNVILKCGNCGLHTGCFKEMERICFWCRSKNVRVISWEEFRSSKGESK